MREALRRKPYSYRTEQAYIDWIKRYILFHNRRHPKDMGAPEIEAFLTYLAVEENVTARTQNQALGALLFLYHEVLGQELDFSIDAVRAKKPKRLPTVLTREEVQRVLARLSGVHLLMAPFLYGSGLRLHVKDLDFARHQIIVRDGKGQKGRITVPPHALVEPLPLHLQQVKRIHQQDFARGYGAVYLPDALAHKSPSAEREWIWQWVFPPARLSVDPRSGVVRRHHCGSR